MGGKKSGLRIIPFVEAVAENGGVWLSVGPYEVSDPLRVGMSVGVVWWGEVEPWYGYVDVVDYEHGRVFVYNMGSPVDVRGETGVAVFPGGNWGTWAAGS